MKIKLYCRKQTAKNGQVFDAYHTFDKDGKRLQVSFRRDCAEKQGAPKESGILEFESKNTSLDMSRRYSVLWIHEYTLFTPFESDGKKVESLFNSED